MAGCTETGGTASDALDYEPVFADGPSDSVPVSIVGKGVSGTMSAVDLFTPRTSLNNVRIRMNANRSVAFLSLNGASEIALAVNGAPSAFGGVYGDISDPSSPVLTLGAGNDYALVGYTQGITASFGFAGIETRPENLPASATLYDGFWGGQAYAVVPGASSDVAGGALEMRIDFAGGGAVTGTLSEGLAPAGTLQGQLVGNGVSGDFTFDAGRFDGEVPFAGKLFGDQAEAVAGSYAGTLRDTSNGQSKAMVGTFSAER